VAYCNAKNRNDCAKNAKEEQYQTWILIISLRSTFTSTYSFVPLPAYTKASADKRAFEPFHLRQGFGGQSVAKEPPHQQPLFDFLLLTFAFPPVP
jgi:hypothetical protein